MNTDESDFTWLYSQQGEAFIVEFRTRPHDPARPPAAEPFLVQRSNQLEPYRPLEEQTALFLTFASTEPTPEGVLHFANRYGRLGKGVETQVDPQPGVPSGEVQPENVCEPLSAWYDRIREFSSWYDLWATRKKGKLVGMGVHHYLAHQFREATKGLLEARIVWDEKQQRPLPKIVPLSLLGAMCLQLAHAVGEDKEYQQCSHCKKWFELAPGLNRADRQFCSDSCRVMAYRARQHRARQLAAEGKTVRQIAKQLGSYISTVEKWLSKGKE
jgi:hypothetical protein